VIKSDCGEGRLSDGGDKFALFVPDLIALREFLLDCNVLCYALALFASDEFRDTLDQKMMISAHILNNVMYMKPGSHLVNLMAAVFLDATPGGNPTFLQQA
jgi:hypothetical protein